MRFLSRFGRFGVQIRHEIREAYATGMTRTIQEPVYAMFHPSGLRPDERELALAKWSFNGLYQEMDEVTTVQPDYRIGVFDSEQAQVEGAWTDELREEVEAVLTDLSVRFNDMLVVPRTFLPPPWPRYDDFRGTPAQLIKRLVEDGHNLEEVLTYERASQNRPRIIAALEEVIHDPAKRGELEPQEEEVLG